MPLRSSPEPEDGSAPRSKRLRVSVACVECRKKKERCDGIQPICTPCQKQNRICQYSASEKKRGLPTGYVRSLEIILGLLLESVRGIKKSTLGPLEEQLKKLTSTKPFLQQQPAGSNHHYVEAWRKSRACKDLELILGSRTDQEANLHNKLGCVIARILDLKSTDHERNSPSDVHLSQRNTEEEVSQSPAANVAATGEEASRMLEYAGTSFQSGRLLLGRQLPTDWHTLVNLYSNTVHCWFPIIPKQNILRNGFALSTASTQTRLSSGELGSLWAVITYGYFQKMKGSITRASESDLRLSGDWKCLSQAVTDLSGGSNVIPETGHIQALLLLALICINENSLSQAWFLVGRAVYMLVDLGLTSRKDTQTPCAMDDESERLSLGCFLLDTLVACRLGRRPYLRTIDLHTTKLSNINGIEEWESWQPPNSSSTTTVPIPAKILSCFSALIEQTAILNDFVQLPFDKLDTTDTGRMIQKILRLGVPYHLSEAELNIGVPTPQSLNNLFATGSFSRYICNNSVDSATSSPLPNPSLSISSLPIELYKHLKEYDQIYSSPLQSIYVYLCTDNKHDTATHLIDGLSPTSTLERTIHLLQQNCNQTTQRVEILHTLNRPAVPIPAVDTITSHELSQAPLPGPSATTITDLYDTLISMDTFEWPDAPRVFLENLGMMPGDETINSDDVFNFLET